MAVAKKVGISIIALALIVLMLVLISPVTKFEQSFYIMGTIGKITLWGELEDCKNAEKAARKEMEHVSEICNLYNPKSELTRLNQLAYKENFKCSNDLWEVLQISREAWEFTNGAFDITAKPLMDLWGFYKKQNKIPTDEEIIKTKEKVGLNKVIFNDKDKTVRFKIDGMALDLGGIAKGFAIDKAYKAVVSLGIKSGVIDIGGNLRLLPKAPPNKDFYTVGLRNPTKKEDLLPLKLEVVNVSLSSSGNYERFVLIDGEKFGHIIDPQTGRATQMLDGVSVIASSAVMADYLSTAIFLRGKKLADKVEKEFKDVEIIFSDKKRLEE